VTIGEENALRLCGLEAGLQWRGESQLDRRKDRLSMSKFFDSDFLEIVVREF
jgi:hypothetical protein